MISLIIPALSVFLPLCCSESLEKEAELKASGMFEKSRLFSHILAVTHAEPNEVERAKLLIDDFVMTANPINLMGEQLSALSQSLAQPEALVRAVDIDSLSKSVLLKESTAVAPLTQIIERIEGLITQYPEVAPLLGDARAHYQAYLTRLLSLPAGDQKNLLEAKALLSGEGLFAPLISQSPSWASSFFSNSKRGISSYRVSQPDARSLASFDESGAPQTSGLGGTNHVSKLFKKDFSVYFKRPSSANDFGAGNEACFYWLAQLLFSRGITPTSVISLSNLKLPAAPGTFHVLQASAGVPGIDFEAFFRQEEDVQKISLESFSEHIVLSLLTNPSDAHYGNLKLVLNSKGLFDIVGIDNDKAFDDELVKQRKKILIAQLDQAGKQVFHSEEFFQYDTQIKTILYCLPQMDWVIPQEVSRRILKLDIPAFMLRWIGRLQQQNYLYTQLRQLGYLSGDYFLEYHAGSFPIQLSTRVVAFITDRLQKMQLFFTDSNNYGATHLNLVFFLSPVVARFYQEVQKSNPGKSPVQVYDVVHSAFNRFKSDKSFMDFVDLAEPINTKETVSQRIDTYLAVADTHERNRIPLEDHGKKLLQETDLLQLEKPGEFIECAIDSFAQLLPSSLASVDARLHKSWFDPDLLFFLVSHGATTNLLQFLLKKGVPVPAESSGKIRSLLGELIKHNYDPLFIAQMLASYDWQSLLNKKYENRYLLDYAFANTNHSLVDLLVASGAYSCTPTIALAFYRKIIKQPLTPADAAFTKLLSLNKELEWHVAFEELLPPLESGMPGMRVSTCSFGDRVLHPEAEASILRGGAFIPVKTPREDHIVCKASRRTRLAEHALYFKIFHELPGIEETVGTILRTVPQVTAPYTELAKFDAQMLKDKAIVSFIKNHSVQDKKITGIPVLISQGVRGHPLASATADELKRLSFQTVSGLICTAFCINPEDGHLHNFVLHQNPFNSAEFELVSVDNKRAFVKAMVRKDPAVGESVRFFRETTRVVPPTVQVKTALYCLNEMDEEVDEKVRARFLSLDIDMFFDQLLTTLEEKLTGYNAIFSPHEIVAFQAAGSYIKIPFEETALDKLYVKLVILKELLGSGARLTHRAILAKLEKLLAKRYDLPHFASFTLAERFSKIDGPFYPQGHTMTQSRDLIDSWACPLEKRSFFEKIKASMTIGPAEARKQLQQLTIAQRQRTALAQDLEGQAAAVNNDSWTSYMRSLDFGILAPNRQELVLDIIVDRDLAEIALLNCSLPIFNWISRMNLSGLVRADFRGCQHLDTGALTLLSDRAKQLRTLNISGTGITILENNKTIFSGDFFLDFPQLEQLVVSGCRKLTSFSVRAPQLRELYLDQCDSLTDPALDAFIETTSHLTKLSCVGCLGIREKLLRQLLPRRKSFYLVSEFGDLRAKAAAVQERWSEGKLTTDAIEFVRQKANANKYAEILYALMQRGIPAGQLNLLDAGSGGNTVLHYAALSDDAESVKIILTHVNQEKEKLFAQDAPPPTLENNQRLSPFDIAVRRGNLTLISSFLAQHFFSIDFKRALSLVKNTECIPPIIAHLLATLNKETELILGEYAISTDHLHLLERILKKQEGRFFNPLALLKKAIETNNKQIIEFLIEHVLAHSNQETEFVLGNYAIATNDLSLLERIFKVQAGRFFNPLALLKKAIKTKNKQIIEFLIEHVLAQPDKETEVGNYAIDTNDLPLLQKILKAQGGRFFNPLALVKKAIETKNKQIIEFLIEYVLAHSNQETEVVLGNYAIDTNDLPLLQKILKAQNQSFFYPIGLVEGAILQNRKEIVIFLSEQAITKPDRETESTLGNYAIDQDDTALLQRIFTSQGDRFFNLASLTRRAVQRRGKKVLDFLFARGADCNDLDSKGNTLMHVVGNNVPIASLLLEKNPFLIFAQNDDEETPFDLVDEGGALFKQLLLIRSRLFERVSDPTLSTDQKRILLFFAAHWGREQLVATLLNEPSLATASSNVGWTALHFAVKSCQKHIVEFLLRRFPLLSKSRTKNRQSAFHIAARFKHPVLLTVLKQFQTDFDFNDRDCYGKTPLHWAATARVNPESISLLLANGARVDEVDDNNLTALETIFSYERSMLPHLREALFGVNILLDAGAAAGYAIQNQIVKLGHQIAKLEEEERRRSSRTGGGFDGGGGLVGLGHGGHF